MMTERKARRLLVIFPGALGDLICVMPAIEAIAARHAGAAVELMARAELARLAAGRTVVARAHSIDAREVGALFADEDCVDANARRFFGDFDRIYSFFASDDPRFRARLASATDAEVSFHPFRPGGEGHVAEAYLRSIDARGLRDEVRLEPTADDVVAAKRVLERANCGSSNLVVVFPGSGSRAKNWPCEKFIALATMLTSESGILRGKSSGRAPRLRSAHLTPNPFPSGKGNRRLGCHGKGDRRLGSVVVLGPAEAALEPLFCESGILVLKGLELATVAGIARLAAAFVGNDSGVSHLAAAVGTPGVAIFGPTDPGRWRPLGRRIDVLARDPIDSIEVGEVAGALAKICSSASKIID